jgi:hypothetical protein
MKLRKPMRIVLAAFLGIAGGAGLMGGVMLTSLPAAAQFWGGWGGGGGGGGGGWGGGGGDPFRPRPRRDIPQQQPQSQNPFGGFFQAPPWQHQQPAVRAPRPPRTQLGDFSKAPPPKKPDTPPTTNVLVMGDAMADWLGHGLEEAYADSPEFGVTRKVRANSGLIRNEGRTESFDWVQSGREYITAEKPDFVVMILGLSDRTSIRERPRTPTRPGQPAQQGQQVQPGQAQPGQAQQGPAQQGQAAQSGQAGQGQQGATAQQGAAAPQGGETKPEQPEAAPGAGSSGPGSATHEFRSEKWGELYARRIDETIAALKSKGVPVVWVGLPPIRGARARSDMTYLNDLYRARAQKAGITFVDVWDGFVDEDGNFSLRGPDYNGQIRQLRSSDGIYFTKAGAVKLAHYVEREIGRLMQSRGIPVALPTTPAAPEPQATPAKPGGPAPRPVAGPVVPLTGAAASPEDLAGSGGARAASADPMVSRVLVRGETAEGPSGRADDFSWPRANADDATVIPAAVVPTAAPVQRPTKKGPAPAEKDKAGPKRGGQSASTTPAAPKQQAR